MSNELQITQTAADVLLVRPENADPTDSTDGAFLEPSASSRFTLLTISGEIDMATADALSAAIDQTISSGSNVALDASGVGFMDSMGLRVLIGSSRRAAEEGRLFGLVAPSPSVTNVLRLTGTDSIFEVLRPTTTV